MYNRIRVEDTTKQTIYQRGLTMLINTPVTRIGYGDN